MNWLSVNIFANAPKKLESVRQFSLGPSSPSKSCNFCSNECTQKNIRGQLIEGILDGDTVEDLLQLKDLTLDKAIQVCQA